MKKKGTISESEFFQLSKSQQAKELKKLTKRANVRLSLLEEKETLNLAYRQAYQYNMNQDRSNNRFYEGTNYKSSNDIKNAFKSVSNFLENKASTLKGIEQSVRETLQPNMDKLYIKGGVYIDPNIINKMSPQEKRYASKIIAQASNKKLADLEKNDIKQYAYELAQHFNEKVEKRKTNRYYRGINFKNDEDLNTQLDEMIHFFNAKTSTVEGYKTSIETRLDAFRGKGLNIPKDREKEFFQFMASDEFKKMGKEYDSSQVANLVNEARNKGYDIEDLKTRFQTYLDKTITFDKIQEDFGITPWLDKETQKPTKFKFKQRKK
jgi:hypothetical protein